MMDSEFKVRVCGVGDEAALSLVASASFLEAFAGVLDGEDILAHAAQNNSAAKFGEWLQAAGYRAAVAEVKGAPVGYAVLCPPDLPVALEDGDVELKRVYLLHRFQGMGAGAALMKWAVGEAREMGASRLLLGVYGGNEAAIAFYKHQGFRVMGTRQFLVGKTLHDDLVLGRSVVRTREEVDRVVTEEKRQPKRWRVE